MALWLVGYPMSPIIAIVYDISIVIVYGIVVIV